MAGIPIAQFLDWAANTGPQFLSGDDNIVNAVSRRSYLLGKFLRGKPASRILQGSDTIQETIYLDAQRTFQEFARGDDIQWTNPQKDVLASIDWKFTLDWMAWDEWEYEGQTSGLTAGGLKTKYKDMAYSKMQRLWESTIDGWESLLFRPPATNTTETSTYQAMEQGGKKIYGIPVWFNENAGSTTGGFSAAWTQVEGIDWATYGASNGNFDCKRRQYDTTDLAGADDDSNGLFEAFDDMGVQIAYHRPGFKDRYFEDETDPGVDLCICTSKKGYTQVMGLHRKMNESLIQPQDAAYPYPRWNGAAILDVQELDDAQLYTDGSTGFVDELDSTVSNSGARYYFLNTRYLNMVFHRAKYFRTRGRKEPESKVGVYVQPVETWGNLTCTNPRTGGVVYPGAA